MTERKVRKRRFWHGDVVEPNADRTCGCCGYANFAYNNGQEFAANGVRGYRCVNCGGIKPERRKK